MQKGLDGEVASSDDFVDPNDGTITEGDDHVWLGNPDVLRGGGGWRNLDAVQLLGKQTQGAAVCKRFLGNVAQYLDHNSQCTQPMYIAKGCRSSDK